MTRVMASLPTETIAGKDIGFATVLKITLQRKLKAV